MPSPVEVGHADHLRGSAGIEGDGIGEPSVPQAREQADGLRAGVDRHQVGRAAGGERPGRHARSRFQARDDG